MKGDFTRTTFRREKHYAAVLMQQGRVQLDSDWNEQNDIVQYRAVTTAVDTIGRSGGPMHDAGFAVVAKVADLPDEEEARAVNQSPPTPTGADLFVSGGRYYVDGQLIENDRICLISEQPDVPKGLPIVRLSDKSDVPFPPATVGTYVVYVDVWQRHITALEDAAIREVALGGPDTATRAQTVWQVKLLQVAPLTNCASDLAEWTALTAASNGKLTARAEPDGESDSPCIVAPGAGYRRLENQLYRVEMHTGGALGSAKFKWSRDNGSIVVACTGKTGDTLLVKSLGRDQVLGFAAGQWAELTDDNRERKGEAGTLFEIADVIGGNGLLIKAGTPTGSVDLADFPKNPRIRRWDSAGAKTITAAGEKAGGWFKLEDGVEVKFEAGQYKVGDYWLIPARTANDIQTAGIEWPRDSVSNAPIAQLPAGVAHRYARLAVVQFDGTAFTVIGDCRKLFPPLTEIEDGEAWHRRHNKYLHGWGVVCGLKVHCDGNREFVQVSKGYAIACDGADIDVKEASRQRVVEMAKAKKLLDAQGTGKVQLLLDRAPNKLPLFDLRADPGPGGKGVWEQVLDGTLAADVYQDCVKPVVEFFQNDLFKQDPNDKALVPEAKKDLIAAGNLLVQLLNKTEASNVFLSRDEHDRLERLYKKIKDFISVTAFCGMFDGLVALPKYPFDTQGIRTAYGRAMQPKLRAHPDGQHAYAFGGSERRIDIFDLKAGAVTAELEVPEVAGIKPTVQDIAFVGDFMLVAVADDDSSVVFLYDAKEQKSIDQSGVLSAMRVVSLGAFADAKDVAFAIVKGTDPKRRGLYRIELKALRSLAVAQPFATFNAVGHLFMGEGASEGVILATSAPDNFGNLVYTQVEVMEVLERELNRRTMPLRTPTDSSAQGRDGLALVMPTRLRAKAARAVTGVLYVAADPSAAGGNKRVLAFDAAKGAPLAETVLPTEGALTLSPAPAQDYLLVAMADQFQLARIDPASHSFDPKLVFPAQIAPTAMQHGAKTLLVGNYVSQTVNIVPATVISAQPGVDSAELKKYRDDMINAFMGLLARLLQMMKDCLCDHLLVDCPECDENDRVVLAAIDIRANKVYSICAFERKDVVTWPKALYWLSAVPIIPIIVQMIERFCCSQLPQLAKAQFGKMTNLVQTKTLVARGSQLTAFDFQAARQEFTSRAALIAKHIGLATIKDVLPPEENVIRVRTGDVISKPAEAVTRELVDSGLTVNKVVEYDEALSGNAIKEIGNLPLDLKPGEKVNLFTRDGKVVFFTREAAPALTGVTAVGDVTRLQRQIESLRADLDSRDRELVELKSSLVAMNKAMKELATLKKQVAELSKKPATKPTK